MTEKKKKKRVKKRLPKTLLPIHCSDKGFHEKWSKKRDPLNLPHPFRVVLLGRPNVGKTSTMKNILVRCKPEFEEILVCHFDGEETTEYDDLNGVEMRDTIPGAAELDPDVKRLVIVDDIEFSNMPKEQKAKLDRLFGYCSTHKNTSIMLTSQDFFNVPAICRRCCTMWIIWKVEDLDQLNTIGRRVGFKKEDFGHIFKTFMPNWRDSLWIDCSENSPFPVRINGYQMIDRE